MDEVSSMVSWVFGARRGRRNEVGAELSGDFTVMLT